MELDIPFKSALLVQIKMLMESEHKGKHVLKFNNWSLTSNSLQNHLITHTLLFSVYENSCFDLTWNKNRIYFYYRGLLQRRCPIVLNYISLNSSSLARSVFCGCGSVRQSTWQALTLCWGSARNAVVVHCGNPHRLEEHTSSVSGKTLARLF